MSEEIEATPRPWQRSQTDDGFWEIRYHGDGIKRALVEHVALFPSERDAQLTTDAVNGYDRLEAAARDGLTGDAFLAGQDREWLAYQYGEEAVVNIASVTLAAVLAALRITASTSPDTARPRAASRTNRARPSSRGASRSRSADEGSPA